MMRWMNRHVVSPDGPLGRSLERLRGTAILDAYGVLLEADRWERARLQQFKDAKLRDLVAHIERQCPWYVDFWREAGVRPADVRGETDLDNLPVLTKQMFRDAQHRGLTAANIGEMQAGNSASGGTTGLPVQLAVSRQSRSFAGAAMLRYYHWWDCDLQTPKGLLWGRADPADKTLRERTLLSVKAFLSQRLVLNTFYVSESIIEDYYHRLYQFDPKMLRGYANSLALFARHVERKGHPVWPSLRMISSTSERLTQRMREEIEGVLRRPISNQYGFGEVNGVAFECPEGRQMHVAEEHVILETVDNQGRRVWDRESPIVVTDLDNYATPLVRYEMGDVGRMTRQRCACGREHQVLAEVVGRVTEAIELSNGRTVSGSYWCTVLRPYPEIEQACVRVVTNAHLQIDLKLTRPLDDRIREFLRREVGEIVGDDVRVEWRDVDHIPPVRSGKFPWVRHAKDERALA